jgi:uncharacterized membrane protein
LLLRLGVSVLAAGGAGAAACRLRWLRPDGAWAAAAVGSIVFGFGGWRGAVPLVVFFLTSTLLGRLPGRDRHSARTWRQVAANGGAAAAAAVMAACGARWAPAALAGGLAAANADTWATELGTRFGGRPRLLAVGPRAEPGASGAMTAFGTLCGCAGAALIAAVAGSLPAAAGGLAGLLADSLLGAAAQAVYRCPDCGARTESRAHPCSSPVRLERGIPWLDNDAVNLAATVLGSAVAAALAASGAPA